MAHATVDRRRRASTGRRLRHVAVGRGRANTQVDAQDQSGRQCGGSLGLTARLRPAWRGSRQAQGSISTACTSPFDQTCSILIKTVLPSISNGTSRRSAAGSRTRSSRVTHFFVPSFILTWNLYSTCSPIPQPWRSSPTIGCPTGGRHDWHRGNLTDRRRSNPRPSRFAARRRTGVRRSHPPSPAGRALGLC
jgi:hypothetical protein